MQRAAIAQQNFANIMGAFSTYIAAVISCRQSLIQSSLDW